MKKQAILLVHFGTTHDDTREKTIDVFRKKVESLFPDCDVFEAFTSRMIIKRLKARGIFRKNPLELLEELKGKGYTHIYVQSSHLLHGIEYENLREEITSYSSSFEKIAIGETLLHSVEDYKKIVSALTSRQSQSSKEAIVYIGHGTEHAANASYPMMRYVFVQEGHPEYFVGTVEGYPDISEVVKDIQREYGENLPSLVLKPFMFVAGEHAKNDIAIDWKENLEEAGFSVSKVVLEGLGEIPEIQDIFIKHLRESFQEKESIAEYKKKLS
ncbi:sirohydrochlorin cobaltochelatase [Fusobacterium necrophorum subsp. funduliforme]|nr:sirohydrochlorin cobaltochelatase [Fusobacterium necrophorum]